MESFDAPAPRSRPPGALPGLIGFVLLLLGYASSPFASVHDTFLILAALFLLVGLIASGLGWLMSRATYGLLGFGTGLALLSVVMTTVIGSTMILGSAGTFAGFAVVVHVVLVLGLGLSAASLLASLASLRFVRQSPSAPARTAHVVASAVNLAAAVAGFLAFIPLLGGHELHRAHTTIALACQVLATLSLLVAFAQRR